MAGCKIEVREKVDNDWWFGEVNGHEGYFPAGYVVETCGGEQVMIMLMLMFIFLSDGKHDMKLYIRLHKNRTGLNFDDF